MENELIDRHIAIVNQAFFQLLEISGNILIGIAAVLSALTLIGMGWLALNEARPQLNSAPFRLACAALAVIALLV